MDNVKYTEYKESMVRNVSSLDLLTDEVKSTLDNENIHIDSENEVLEVISEKVNVHLKHTKSMLDDLLENADPYQTMDLHVEFNRYLEGIVYQVNENVKSSISQDLESDDILKNRRAILKSPGRDDVLPQDARRHGTGPFDEDFADQMPYKGTPNMQVTRNINVEPSITKEKDGNHL